MSPLRVDLTMRLADDLGVLDGLRVVPAPVASDDLLATVHSAALIEAVGRPDGTPAPTTRRTGSAARTTRSSRTCTRRPRT